MITLKHIDKELLICDGKMPTKHFVGVGVEINALGITRHVGLVFFCDDGYFLFHFNGSDVEIEEEPLGWYFKKLDFINSEFCNQFFGHCKKIKDIAKPVNGYFYPGSYYSSDGVYCTNLGLPEYMSCVGFCINVVKGFIEADEYFHYQDWTNLNGEFDKKYISDFIEKYKKIRPDMNEELISNNIRRITPPEYLASAYLEELPIRRNAVRNILNLVTQAIREKKPLVHQN